VTGFCFDSINQSNHVQQIGLGDDWLLDGSRFDVRHLIGRSNQNRILSPDMFFQSPFSSSLPLPLLAGIAFEEQL
jgi:hypothetical protein